MHKYEQLEKLKSLLDQGAISAQEYDQEKNKILAQTDTPPLPRSADPDKPFGLDVNTYCLLMHLSLLLAHVGGVIALVLWLIGKDKSPQINEHGKAVINWLIHIVLASFIFLFGAALLVYRVPSSIMLIFPVLWIGWIITLIVFAALGAIKAQEGKLVQYPILYPFIK